MKVLKCGYLKLRDISKNLTLHRKIKLTLRMTIFVVTQEKYIYQLIELFKHLGKVT